MVPDAEIFVLDAPPLNVLRALQVFAVVVPNAREIVLPVLRIGYENASTAW